MTRASGPRPLPGAPSQVFDDNTDGWAAWQDTPWGTMRYRLAAKTLSRAIEPLGPGCQVLDVGGGDGRDSIPLAERGHHVTIVDYSAGLLGRAEAAATAAGVGQLVRTVHADLVELAESHFAGLGGGFDVLLCHNVLHYLARPLSLVARMAEVVRVGGALSLMAPNPAMDVLAMAVRQGNPVGARELLGTATVRSVTFNYEMGRLGHEEVEVALAQCFCAVTDRLGIRCVTDLIADNDVKSDPKFFADLERLELELCGREPYWRTARFWQLLARRTGP